MRRILLSLGDVSPTRSLAGRFNELITANFCVTALVVTFFPGILEWMGVDFSRGGVLSIQLLFIYFSSLTFLGFFLSRLDIEIQTMATFLHRGFDFLFFTYFYLMGEFQLLFVAYVMMMGPTTAFVAFVLWRKERTYDTYWKALIQRVNVPTASLKMVTAQGYALALIGLVLMFCPQWSMDGLGMGLVTEPYQFGFFRFYGLMMFFLGFTYFFNGFHAIAGFTNLVIVQQLYFLTGFIVLSAVVEIPQRLFMLNIGLMLAGLLLNLMMLSREEPQNVQAS
ncbi:MAG: hypothetical protein HOK97_10865 [Deltaproteobacteria bacterium]|jgi:hypothetical protein|nr:hypothetical protein [Deltaproteobacteria bacterium]MBT6490254.1 hypothetical protein [Deltaproteobacteria bacterium]